MPDVHQVIVQVQAPKRDDPGQVTYGWYTLADGVLTMTDKHGKPATDAHGKTYTQKIDDEKYARAMACMLTKRMRLAFRGKSSGPEGFDRPLRYRSLGIV